MPEVIVLKHGKCAGTEASINSFGATVVSWKVDGAENIFVSSLAKTDGTKARTSPQPRFEVFFFWIVCSVF